MIHTETADAHSGRLDNTFDKDKVQRELDLQRDVSLTFSRNVGEARAEINRHLDTLKEKLEKGEIGREDYEAQTRNWQRGQILLNSIATGLSAPTQSGIGIAAPTASPALSYKIGQYFKGKAQQNPDGRLTARQETAHIILLKLSPKNSENASI